MRLRRLALALCLLSGLLVAGTLGPSPAGKTFGSGDALAYTVPLVVGQSVSTAGAGEIVGGNFVDPTLYVRANLTAAWVFRATVSVDEVAATGYVQLYNLTDAAQVCLLSTSSADPVELSQALTLGAGNFSAAKKHYEIRIYITGGVTPTVTLQSASVDVRITY